MQGREKNNINGVYNTTEAVRVQDIGHLYGVIIETTTIWHIRLSRKTNDGVVSEANYCDAGIQIK